MDQASCQERATERAEVQVPTFYPEAFDHAFEGARREARERVKSARDSNVAGRERVETAETAQEHHARRSRADAGQLADTADRVAATHAREGDLGQLAVLDRARPGAAFRLSCGSCRTRRAHRGVLSRWLARRGIRDSDGRRSRVARRTDPAHQTSATASRLYGAFIAKRMTMTVANAAPEVIRRDRGSMVSNAT